MSRRIKKKSSNIDVNSNSTKAEVKIDKNVYDHLRPDKIKQKAEVAQTAAGSSINTFLVIGLIGIVIVAMTLSGVFQGGLDLGTNTNDENTFTNNFDSVLTKDVCMDPSHTTVVSHYHISLNVFINDIQQIIPAEIGISASCMKPIHTHGVDGTLHVELPSGFSNTPNLGDFFAIGENGVEI